MTAKGVRANIVAEEFGFTPRYSIRMASQGKIPGAWQPSGSGGIWLFDLSELRIWKAEQIAERRDQAKRVPTSLRPTRAETLKVAVANQRPLDEEIDWWLKAAFRAQKAPKR